MTGKYVKSSAISNSNLSKFELEIERLRDENKWSRLKEYVTNISSNKDQKYENLIKFCIAENDLESYLFSNPISIQQTAQQNQAEDESISKYSKIIYNCEIIFKDVISGSNKSGLIIESSILLLKLLYSQARFDEAFKLVTQSIELKNVFKTYSDRLKNYNQSKLELKDFIKSDSLRQLQLYAELHSLKSLCLEYQKRVNKTDSINEQDIIDSYEISSILAIQHSLLIHYQTNSNQVQISNEQNQSTGSNFQSDDNLDLINPLYEISLQKAPLLLIKRGDLQLGIKKFRELLLQKNIQSISSIRQVLLKKFAECLMFNIPVSQYSSLRSPFNDEKHKSLYKPLNQDEEILLCLKLSQYLASNEVMLLRQNQFKNIRQHTFNNAITSLDLLLIFLSYNRSYNILLDKFEMCMKYSFEEFYVWYQYGLSLMCCKNYYKAYMVLKECIRMRPDHLTCYLLLAQISLEKLFRVNESIEYSLKAINLSNNKNKKSFILFGSALCFKAKLQKQHALQISFYEQALEAFKKAYSIDSTDYLPLYHMSRCYAILRQINEAVDSIQKALKFKPDDKDSLHLLGLLLTSTKNYEDAHTIMCKVCALYDDYELLYTKIRIEEVLFGFNHSVNSLLNLIFIYKQKLQQPSDNMSTKSSSVSLSQPGVLNATKNLVSSSTQNVIDNWSSYENACSLNLQQYFRLNESLGKTITMWMHNDNQNSVLILTRLLTQIGEFYLRNDKLNDAEMCCQEMALINPMSYLCIYLKGRVYEYKEDFVQAKMCYQNALSINPNHIQSLQQLALVLCHLKNFHLAEKMIRDAISLNSSLPDSWHILARVLDYQNDNQSALKCYQTCLQLESTNPILPFTSLTKIL